MDTKRTQYEIEIALAKSEWFDFRRNIVAFNVNGVSSTLPIFHECDMLVVSKSGYLTEIEIKRSFSDFLADFKKSHSHEGRGVVKFFYYCVPASICAKVVEELDDREVFCSGIITYDEELKLKKHPFKMKSFDLTFERINYRKLFLEQQLEVARLGAMRQVMLKEKLSKIE